MFLSPLLAQRITLTSLRILQDSTAVGDSTRDHSICFFLSPQLWALMILPLLGR